MSAGGVGREVLRGRSGIEADGAPWGRWRIRSAASGTARRSSSARWSEVQTVRSASRTARCSSRVTSSADLGPVEPVIVDVEVDQAVGPDQVGQVEVIRDRSSPGRAGRPRPCSACQRRIGPGDRPHPDPGIGLHPARGQDQVAPPEARARLGAAGRFQFQGRCPLLQATRKSAQSEQERRGPVVGDLAEQVLGREPAGVGHRQGEPVAIGPGAGRAGVSRCWPSVDPSEAGRGDPSNAPALARR